MDNLSPSYATCEQLLYLVPKWSLLPSEPLSICDEHKLLLLGESLSQLYRSNS